MLRSRRRYLTASTALAACGLMTIGPVTAAPVAPAPAVHSAAITLTAGGHPHHHYRYYGRPFAYGIYAAPSVVVRPSGCGWLRVRAVETGSRYWWRRYRDCVN
jgi:hypothetical protein